MPLPAVPLFAPLLEASPQNPGGSIDLPNEVRQLIRKSETWSDQLLVVSGLLDIGLFMNFGGVLNQLVNSSSRLIASFV